MVEAIQSSCTNPGLLRSERDQFYFAVLRVSKMEMPLWCKDILRDIGYFPNFALYNSIDFWTAAIASTRPLMP